jgi:hypothetical protein
MSGMRGRLWPVLGGVLLAAGVLAGCGDGDGGTAAPPATTAPAATSAPPQSSVAPEAADAACADIKQIKQGISDLETAVRNADLNAGQTAWSTLTAGVQALADDAKTARSDAAQKLHDQLAPVTTDFAELDTAGKLAAVVTALTTLGPNLNATIDEARENLHCPD